MAGTPAASKGWGCVSLNCHYTNKRRIMTLTNKHHAKTMTNKHRIKMTTTTLYIKMLNKTRKNILKHISLNNYFIGDENNVRDIKG